MRVLHVVQELRRGGAETVVHALVHGLTKHDVHSEVAAADGPFAAAFDVPLHPLPMVARRPNRLGPGAWALRQAITRSRAELVHCHNPTMALLAAPGTHRGHNPPALVTVHGVEASGYRRAAQVLRLSGLPVIACGPAVSAALAGHGMPVARTVLNGVAPAATALDRSVLRRSLGLDPGAFVVASVGRLVGLKRHDLAVRATARLPGVTLLLVGTGPHESELRRLATTLGVADRVVLTGLREDVSALMGAVDAVLLCSRGEGLPLTLLEALTAGAPVVAVDAPGLTEVLQPEHDALVCGDTPESLAGTVSRLLADPGLAARLSAAGRRTASPYAESRMLGEYLDVYNRVLDRGVL